MTFTSINPATGETLSTYPELALTQALQRAKTSHDAFKEWKHTSFSQRAAFMKKAAEVLLAETQSLAKLMTQEMGKPLSQSIAEVEKCAWVCNYFADNAERFLQPDLIETDACKSFVAYEPIGVVLAIMPWNFPFWQVFRAVVPALMAGNGMMLKHASNVPGCAQVIEKVFKDADFPEGLFQTLLITSQAATSLIESPHIQAVTLTGSLGAGKSVGAKAGGLIKKCVLELGGSDPYVVLEDANLEQAVPICVSARLINSG